MQIRAANKYDADTYVYWKSQIDSAEKYREKFITKGDNIIKRYRDDDRLYDGERRYNILYSNTETLQPVVYSSHPKAVATARDSKNITARKGGEMIEKGIDYYVGLGDFDDKARLAVTDFLLTGQGLMRPKYNPVMEEFEEVVQPLDIAEGDNVIEKDGVFTRKVERVVYEEISFEYTHWKDFIYPDCNCWDELPWVSFRTYLTPEEAKDMFGSKKAALLNYESYRSNQNKDLDDLKSSDGQKKAKVYEIWDKGFRQQLFFAETTANALLEINDDPLELEGFFPVPKPMFSITTSGTLLPVPFFVMYQDQAMELDDINSRICAMVDNMKRRGFYDASIGELANIASMGDNEFWPVKNWNEFSGKGGLNGAMQVEDVTSYANILVLLSEKRQQLLDDIYQIIGISDIRRGQTDPRETLGAQQMKGRYGTIRISTYQRKVAEFMRDLLKIAGEIIINQFEPETVALITNMPLETKVERGENGEITKVLHVGVKDLLNELRTKKPSDIIVDIETDSTIVEDSDGIKKDLLEITSALSEFVGVAEPMSKVIGLDATANLLLSIVQKFKLGRNIQQQVQDHVDEVKAQVEASKGQPPEPTPEEKIIAAELEKEAMRLNFAGQELAMKSRVQLAEIGVKQQANMIKARELEFTQEIDSQIVDLKAIDGMLKFEALKIEAKNSKDNAVVGV